MRRQIIDVLDNNSNIVLYVLIENFNEGISHEDKRKIVENIEDFKEKYDNHIQCFFTVFHI